MNVLDKYEIELSISTARGFNDMFDFSVGIYGSNEFIVFFRLNDRNSYINFHKYEKEINKELRTKNIEVSNKSDFWGTTADNENIAKSYAINSINLYSMMIEDNPNYISILNIPEDIKKILIKKYPELIHLSNEYGFFDQEKN
jgi:hypothetical protein